MRRAENSADVEKVWSRGRECGIIPHSECGTALFDAVEMQFVVERLTVDAEQFGRLRLVAARRRERPADLLLLRGPVAQGMGRRRGFRRRHARDLAGKVPAGDVLAESTVFRSWRRLPGQS